MTKKKIAVLGGGLGSMAALAWITSQPKASDLYDITVYQMGHRLGGKGASGRGVGKRVEEHGLHIWFGFYENAFRTMRMALEEIGKASPPPVATFPNVEAAFTPQSLVTFEESWNGQNEGWAILFPPNGGTPGVGEPVLDFWEIAEDILGWFVVTFDQFTHGRTDLASRGGQPELSLGTDESKLLEGVEGSTTLHRALALVKKARGNPLLIAGIGQLVALLIRAYLDFLWLLLKDHLDDAETRRFFILNDLGGTLLVGILRERLFERGFETADDRDWVDWLRQHGARDCSATSAPVRTVYDLVFGFRDGDTNQPIFAAGTAVRGLLRMVFTYKGCLMQKMNAGMGDTIFTPFYGLLKQRGVKFEFFHKVDGLRLSSEGGNDGSPTIDRIELTRQVNLLDPKKEYWPLERVKDLDCWPSEPLWDQIADADALKHDPNDPGRPYDLESWWTAWTGVEKRTLVLGEDFHTVLLGIPVGTFPFIARDLIDRLPAWKRMVEGEGEHAAVATTPTLGVQLWLTKTAEQLGWVIPSWAQAAERQWGKPIGLSTLLGGYVQALDTIADMSHLLPVEAWPAGSEPASVQYLCGPWKEPPGPHPFTDHAYPRQERERLIAEGIAWLNANAAYVWPNGSTPALPTGLDPMLLVALQGGSAESRWAQQWWRVNIDPNERYVLSAPKSTASRIACDDTGVANLLIAGDWTWNPVLNAGCVEASVASGMECARVLTGQPIEIAGS